MTKFKTLLFLFVFVATICSGADMMGVSPVDLSIRESTNVEVSMTTFVVGIVALCGMIYNATRTVSKIEYRLGTVEDDISEIKENCKNMRCVRNNKHIQPEEL